MIQLLTDYWSFITTVAIALGSAFIWWNTKRKKVIADSQDSDLDRIQGYIDTIKSLNSTIVAIDGEKTSKEMTINELKVKIKKLEAFQADVMSNCHNMEACVMKIKQRHD